MFSITGILIYPNLHITQVLDTDSFLRILLHAFIGVQANRVKEDLSEKLQLEIAKLKAKLKMCKNNQLMLEKYESEASDFMKQRMREAAKLKGTKVGDLWFPY